MLLSTTVQFNKGVGQDILAAIRYSSIDLRLALQKYDEGNPTPILHTYIHTYTHTYIHTYYIHTYIQHTYIHTTYIHTYIQSCIYTSYIHTHIHTKTLFSWMEITRLLSARNIHGSTPMPRPAMEEMGAPVVAHHT